MYSADGATDLLDGLEAQAAYSQLAISCSQCYRERQRGVAAVAALLRERWDLGPAGPAAR